MLLARYVFICKYVENKSVSHKTQPSRHSSAKQQLKQTKNDEIADELAVEVEVDVKVDA